MPLVWKLYADLLTGDGVADDDISAYWMSTNLVQGFRTEDQNIADIGRCVITLKNVDQRFSPSNTGGPYYGNLIAGRVVVVKVINDGGSEIAVFRGVVDRKGWQPNAGIKSGPFTCTLVVVDAIKQLQEAKVAVPLMQDFQPDVIIKLIVNAAFNSKAAKGYIEFIDAMSADDTITISQVSTWTPFWTPGATLGIQSYTLKSTLTGAANEVLIETDTDGSDITPENIAAAINRDLGEGTAYGTGTARNAGFSALARARTGVNSAGRDGWVALQDVASGYEKLSTSFVVETDTITTNFIWLYLKKTGSPTGTATIKFILNRRGLPNDVQYKTIEGTFLEAGANSGGGWVRVTLDDYITFRRHQRYHVELSTDRAASAVNYIEWGEISGTNNYSAENTGGTWTSLGTAFVWCIPGRVDVKARWPGTLFNYMKFTSSNSSAAYWVGQGTSPPPPNIAGGTDGTSLMTLDDDPDTIQLIGDQWSAQEMEARQCLLDTLQSCRGYLWADESGYIIYKKRDFPFAAIIDTPAITLDNEQNETVLGYGEALINLCRVEFEERREITGTVVARATGSIEYPPNVKVEPEDYPNDLETDKIATTSIRTEVEEEAKQRQGARFNPNDDIEKTTTTIPFVDDDRGVITGAKDIIQPVPGTDFTLTTETDGGGRNLTWLAQTRGGGMKLTTALSAGGVDVTWISRTGLTSVFVNDLQIKGTALLRLNTDTVIFEDLDSTYLYGIKDETIRLPSMTLYGRELAESLAYYRVHRNATEREFITSCGFKGQTTVNGVKLYSVNMGDIVVISEDQTGIDAQKSMVIGRTISASKDKSRPQLTWVLRPISDQTYLILDNVTYGVLPGNLAI